MPPERATSVITGDACVGNRLTFGATDPLARWRTPPGMPALSGWATTPGSAGWLAPDSLSAYRSG